MPTNSDKANRSDQTDKYIMPITDEQLDNNDKDEAEDLIARMERSSTAITKARPHLTKGKKNQAETSKYQALLEVSKAINSSLVTDDILQIVMKNAIEVLKAERGFLMLLDEQDKLKIRTVYNLCKEEMMEENFNFSGSIAYKVAKSGESIYTSDAVNDKRFSNQKSIAELNLRSILCVPLKIKEKIIGVIYLDNSSVARLFLESDLYLFELYASQAAIAIYNSRLYSDLLRLKRFNENVVSNTPVGLIVLNNELKIVIMNSSAEGIFAKKLSATKPLSYLLQDKSLQQWGQLCENVISSGIIEEITRSYITVGEVEKVLSIKISPLEEVDYLGNGVVIVIEDITEKTILENYVTISEKLIAKGEMAASVGHELNNFLAIILNNAELLMMMLKKGKFDKVERSANTIINNIDKIKRFTDNLMDLSKLDQEPVNYNLNHLIDDMIFTVKSQRRFKEITFKIKMDPYLPDCSIDVGQIQQVFLNLFYNAADALAESTMKEIVITTEVNEKYIVATLRDNGAGITENNISKIFELHFSTKKDGHGLGLSNSKRILENHSGSISVTSEENKFTKFEINLPRIK